MKEIIITSSVLILCIMLIRFIFKGKISGRLQYALWLLVALRLIIPSSAQIHMAIGSLEEFRIMDLVEALEERFGDVTEQLEEPMKFTMSFNSPLAGRVSQFMLSADGPTSVFVAGRIGFSWLDILRGTWIGGMAIIALWMIITNIVFSHRLHKERKEFVLPEELESIYRKSPSDRTGHRSAGKAGKIKFYTTDYLTSSCLYGMPGREAVYLTPDIAEDQNKLRHVVIHEMCHRKHGDSFWAILRSILISVYWMNPLVWVAAVLSKRDCELACDEEALLILGEEERIPYGETLLSIITGKSRLSDIACTATTMKGGGKSVKERIKFIAEKPKVLGAAVVAVLLLIIIVSVFVFTKQPLYNGYTWEGEMTLTAGDMRVRLPETIAGISSYDTERDGNDIIIYQLASGKETGRFSVLSYESAVRLVDEGREVIPVESYGLNDYLKSYIKSLHTYIPTESTTHFYSPKEIEPEEKVPEWGDNNPMLDSDWEVVPLEEETDYLPNEQITTIETATDISSEKCYVYVKADYSDVKDQYLDEMEYINSELETAAGRVIVISINQKIRDEMFEALAKNRTEYLGDASRTGAIVNALPQVDGLTYKNITLHTLQTEPETALSLDVRYELTAQNMSEVDKDILLFNAVMIFATIRNLEECNFIIDDNVSGTRYKADYLNDSKGIELVEQYETLTYSRSDLEEVIGILWSDEATDSDESYAQWLEDLYSRVVDYLR